MSPESIGPEWISQVAAHVGSRPVDLDALLSRVVSGVAVHLRADRATLYLLDRARGELVSRVATELANQEIRLRLGEGIAGEVGRTGETVLVADVSADPRFADRYDAMTGYRTKSLMATGVRGADGALVGVLQVLNRAEGTFGRADRRELEQVARQVGRLLDATSLRSQLHGGARPLAFRFNGIVGESAGMQRVYARADRASRTDATVLILGETGTGKELVASAVHHNSPRADGPFVKVDCGALPGDLVENELFGHERGAYTGAVAAADGKVAAADGGTLFLDEVAELPLPAQSRLLRLLQDRTWFRVGGTTLRTADVRLVAATHQDLPLMVEEGRFRRDLYYRLRVVEIRVPPLRERDHADLDRLIDHLLFEAARRYGRPGIRISPAARARLHGHLWPGNVRELEHALASAVVLTPGDTIEAGDVEVGPAGPGIVTPPPAGPDGIRPLRAVVHEAAAEAVRRCGGNRSEAARRLGIGRNTLLRHLKAHDGSVPSEA